ncbi:MAG: MFS transporter [Pseudooceanicola sp.]
MTALSFLRDNAQWLLAGALLSFLSSFGQTFFISIFAGEIREIFDLSNGQWGGLYTIGTGASAATMIWAGSLADHYRARALIPAVLGFLALACFAMSAVNSIVLLVVVIYLLRLCGQGMTSHVAMVSMSRWFVASRGKALAFATLGFATGEAILPLAFVALKAETDWRVLWRVAGCIVLGGLVILLLLLRRERTPQSFATDDQSAGLDNRHWTRGEVLRHWLYWLMLPALIAPPAFGTAFLFHQVAYAEAKGWAHISLVAFFPLYTGLAVLSGLLWGAALDKWGTRRLLPWSHVPAVAAFLLFGFADEVAIAGLGLACYAVTTGSQATLPSAFWAEHFGTRNVGSIKAVAMAVMVLGSALGPGITGALLDAGISLSAQYTGIAAWFLCGVILMRIGMIRVARSAAVAP